MTRVSDVMDNDMVAVAPTVPVIEVAQRMLQMGRHVIPVCDHGKFRGIIRERDIVVGVVATARDPVRVFAGELMSNHLPLISPGVDLMKAVETMASNGLEVLPVVQNGRFLGLLTLDNLSRKSQALAALIFTRSARLASRESSSPINPAYAGKGGGKCGN
ncbi:MAG: CBS domain-containing protein [Chloroflexi bacterium]|nr:CBS domain-containing protein [Chloroflexota bacterium]